MTPPLPPPRPKRKVTKNTKKSKRKQNSPSSKSKYHHNSIQTQPKVIYVSSSSSGATSSGSSMISPNDDSLPSSSTTTSDYSSSFSDDLYSPSHSSSGSDPYLKRFRKSMERKAKKSDSSKQPTPENDESIHSTHTKHKSSSKLTKNQKDSAHLSSKISKKSKKNTKDYSKRQSTKLLSKPSSDSYSSGTESSIDEATSSFSDDSSGNYSDSNGERVGSSQDSRLDDTFEDSTTSEEEAEAFINLELQNNVSNSRIATAKLIYYPHTTDVICLSLASKLYSNHLRMFPVWAQYLVQFNLLFYGIGSKHNLLNHFCTTVCTYYHRIIVQCASPAFSSMKFLDTVRSLVHFPLRPEKSNLSLCSDYIEKLVEHIKCPSPSTPKFTIPIVFVFHNFDTPSFLDTPLVDLIESLLETGWFRFLGTTNNAFCSLEFQQSFLSKAQALWINTSTFSQFHKKFDIFQCPIPNTPDPLHYGYEGLVHSTSKRKRYVGMAGIKSVLASVPYRTRQIVYIILLGQIEHMKTLKSHLGYIGRPLKFYLGIAQKKLLVRSVDSLVMHLRELVEHDIIIETVRKGQTFIRFNLDQNSLIKLKEDSLIWE